MKDKSKEFLEDIGLGNSKAFMDELMKGLETPYTHEVDSQDNNVLPFFSEHAAKMDFPENSIQVHIENMIATYGEEKTFHVIKVMLQQHSLKVFKRVGAK